MNNFLKHIPGFRSDKKWKKIIAILYYLFSLLMLTEGVGLFLFLIGIPFFIFSIGDVFKAKKNNKPVKAAAIGVIISLLVTSVGFAMIEPTKTDVTENEKPIVKEAEKEEPKEVEEPEEPKEPEKEPLKEIRDLKVHFIDVGQGDSILIQLPNGETALIDAGSKDSGELVVEYLKKQEVKEIDYLIASHPHKKHIGGLPEVIKSFDVNNIYIPDISRDTEDYKKLLSAIKEKDLDKNITKAEDTLIDLDGLSFTALAPDENIDDDDLNNHSIVLKLTYKNNSFLFTGNAEAKSEQSIIDNDYDLRSSVLKVAHYGSNTSTTDQFLEKIKPNHAIISVNSDNKYGYPNKAVIDKLTNSNAKIHRTDEKGTIVFTSNGTELKVEFKKTKQAKKENAPPKQKTEKPKETTKETKQNVSQSSQTQTSKKKSSQSSSSGSNKSGGGGSGNTASKPKPPETDNVAEVYITETGGKYHTGGCRYLKKSKIPISLQKAKSQGYEPCGVCHPPH